MKSDELLVFDKKNMEYLLVIPEDKTIKCDNCKKILDVGRIIKVYKAYTRRKMIKGYYCIGCETIKPREMIITDPVVNATITTDFPPSGIVQSDDPPSLKTCTDTNLFIAVHSDEGITADTSGCQVIDRTVISNDPNRNIELNHKTRDEKLQVIDNRLNKEVKTERQVDKFFDEVLKAKPVIDEYPKKQIQNSSTKKNIWDHLITRDTQDEAKQIE
jgi:hypothetical protein